jgi:murein DD-endopeptidase MepM/ murein hydrolase activator NlpD
VYATQGGEVIEVNYNRGGGNQIFIRHKDGSISGYAHTVAAEGITKGTRVYGGQHIGNSDSSGYARLGGAHLHYTYKPGTPFSPATLATPAVDPMIQLQRAVRPAVKP